ncbi:FAD:protein FMN transferase [Chitinophaga eiseniae]|uniref:FAD:protein FMN transferase n=1 Tax=Chitinophaga eiseniae TaxID=634771 RepID=A0A847SHX6_9BACT|nr:FAD:protein FMN transferase [Chitinophaga eiseniae]NLR81441.1 FAD:protein FMN transferase [Chitinophaga eiseniae]
MPGIGWLLWIWIAGIHSQVIKLEGSAQGTTWHVMYTDARQRNFQAVIVHALEDIDQCLSHYRPDSELSLFNKTGSWQYQLPYFYPVLQKSAEVYAATNGAFDPTVMPLTEAYRQGKRTHAPWWQKADSLLQYVGFTNIAFDEVQVHQLKAQVRLDFDGIAQGYSVDVIARLLEQQGVTDYMVEIGGEVRCKGLKNGAPWTIAIDYPLATNDRPIKVSMYNKSATTAGNYRDYYQQQGKTFAHIVNPKTGFSTPTDLLSVTVFADDAITADAYDTAFMVMGLAATQQFLARRKDLDACLIYRDANGKLVVYMTPGLKQFVN